MRVLPSLVVLLLLAVGATASAQTLRVSVDRTNLRERPAIGAPAVVVVEKDAVLQVLARDGMWYRVRVLR